MLSQHPDDVPSSDVRWCLQNHPVIITKKPGKVRTICNCAGKHQGVSLKDYLHQIIGPNMVQNLVAVLTRLRKENFVLIGDIQEMFLLG